MATIERVFAADLRCTDGHFPGNPIVPGAVLLSEALVAITDQLGIVLQPCQIKAAKFLQPVRPGDRIVIDYVTTRPGEFKFTCTVDGTAVLTGSFLCEVMANPA